MANLSSDSIFEILLKLPTKTLARFKFVSKPWFSLISNKTFVDAHACYNHSQPIGKTSNMDLKLVVCTKSSIYGSSISVFDNALATAIGGDGKTEATLRPCGLPFSGNFRKDIKFVGSCNGLVCLHAVCKSKSTNLFFIWNPCTGEYKQLPHIDDDAFICEGTGQSLFCGFGFDSIHDDYKVVVGMRNRGYLPTDKSQVAVFSLNANSWKFIYDSPRRYIFGQVHFLNGALHWRGTILLCPLLSFNLADEKFIEISTPDDCTGLIGVLSGCLCLVRHLSEGPGFEVWTMKEYGVKESWTMLSTFQPPAGRGFDNFAEFSILACPSDTEVLWFLSYKSKLAETRVAAYDPKEGSFNICPIGMYRPIAMPFFDGLAIFRETLVSPHCANALSKEDRIKTGKEDNLVKR